MGPLINEYVVNGPETALHVTSRDGRVHVVIFDTEDLDRVRAMRWRISKPPYAVSVLRGRHIQMSRMVAGTPLGLECDHFNHNTLDNRKANLRNVTRSVNRHNLKVKPKNFDFSAGIGKYRVRVNVNGRCESFGVFDSPEAAATVAAKLRKILRSGKAVEGNRRSGRSGTPGISWHEGRRSWRVYLQPRSGRIFLGWFDNLKDAEDRLRQYRQQKS